MVARGCHQALQRLIAALTFICLAWTTPPHAAEWNMGATEFALNTTVGFGAFVEGNADFGAGSYDIRNVRDYLEGRRPDPGNAAQTAGWVEAFIKPGLHVSHDVGANGKLFVHASLVYATTQGHGDASPYSYTGGHEGYVSLEEAYVGYSAPLPFGLKGDSIVVKIGKQDFTLSDGFLVQLGKYDTGKSGGYYIYPRTAFDGWGTIKINAKPVRADIFVLRTDVDNNKSYGDWAFALDQPRTHFAGFDIEWFDEVDREGANGALNYLDRKRYLNFTYFNIYKTDRNPVLYPDSDEIFWSRRQGLNVFSLNGGGNLIPIKNTGLYFQYVREINTHPGRRVDASAFYIEPQYTFSDSAWTPRIYYRYSYFSGQPGRPSDPIGTKRNYDIMFLGGGVRNFFGCWGYGEIIGNMMQFTSNLTVHNVSVKVTAPFHVIKPDDSLALELIGYKYLLDNPLRESATSRDYGSEVDLTAQYTMGEMSIGAALGIAMPGKGGKEAMDAFSAGFPNRRPATGDSYIAEFFIYQTF